MHYAGHGAFKREVSTSGAAIWDESFSAKSHAQAQQDPSGMTDEAYIYLDHAEKFTEPMSAEQFALFFTDYPFTRLVFLNACQGATRSSQQALIGFAPQLVLRGVPAVVAMQNKIDNDDAILFATEFYSELFYAREGGQVEIAITTARKTLLQKRPESPAFGNPVMYLRAKDGRLWENAKSKVGAPSPPPPKDRKSFWKRWETRVGVIIGILTIIGWLLDLLERIDKLKSSKDEKTSQTEIVTSYLRVLVFDSTSQAPLADVMLTVAELPVDSVLSGKTTSEGGFHFANIPAPTGARARVYAKKEGYRGKNEYTFLPGPLRLELEKIK